ncbi:unnamed protein product [Parnassius apollo]|uniref:(apollo) hypothetical protein n=1 Tax=Parnassius apollo TaxID=110799 RepID=A0A8S3X8Q8_PARAO|nr:unnamed protein product [Parnassius apollo]
MSEHDTDSEQECDDQVFSNYDESSEISNEEHLGLGLVNESMEALESAFSDCDEEPLINISSSNFNVAKRREKLQSRASITNLPRDLRQTVEEDLYHHFRIFNLK